MQISCFRRLAFQVKKKKRNKCIIFWSDSSTLIRLSSEDCLTKKKNLLSTLPRIKTEKYHNYRFGEKQRFLCVLIFLSRNERVRKKERRERRRLWTIFNFPSKKQHYLKVFWVYLHVRVFICLCKRGRGPCFRHSFKKRLQIRVGVEKERQPNIEWVEARRAQCHFRTAWRNFIFEFFATQAPCPNPLCAFSLPQWRKRFLFRREDIYGRSSIRKKERNGDDSPSP